MFMKRLVSSAYTACLAALLAIVPGVGAAQDFPNRTVRIIVPSSPGVLLDTLARLMSTDMGKMLGQSVIVENKPGANQLIGYEYVAKQVPADGYAMAIFNVPGLATIPAAIKGLRFDPLKDIVPFLTIGESRSLFGSASSVPWKTFAELVSYAKANPGKLNYGTSSLNARLATEALVHDIGIKAAHIPYPAAGAYVLALSGGEVHMGFVSDATVVTMGERFRVLAQSGEQRRAPFMDVPTFTELGFPQIRGLSFALGLRAGTPQAVIDKLRSAGQRALAQAEVKTSLAKLQLEPSNDSIDMSIKRLADEGAFFADIAKKVGVEPQ